jgi:predicted transposase YbfD/YdcC
LAHWVADLASRHPELSHIRIDGKVLRGSGDDAAGLRPLQLVSAWVDECRLVLGQVAADPDSNEITAIPKLLEILDLHGSLVTIDAAGCQSNIATAIVDGGGDYLLAVKGNQPTLEEEVSDAFLEAGENDYAGLDRAETQETNRGRQERRTCIVLPEVSVLSEAKKWPHVQGLVLVSTLRLDGDDEQGDVRYYITSRKASAAELLAATRGHWGIENRLHWVLDVTFGEDACRSHTGHSAQNLGVLRRLAVSLLQRAGGEESVKCRRLRACADNGYLEQVLQGGASPEPAKAKTSKQ